MVAGEDLVPPARGADNSSSHAKAETHAPALGIDAAQDDANGRSPGDREGSRLLVRWGVPPVPSHWDFGPLGPGGSDPSVSDNDDPGRRAWATTVRA